MATAPRTKRPPSPHCRWHPLDLVEAGSGDALIGVAYKGNTLITRGLWNFSSYHVLTGRLGCTDTAGKPRIGVGSGRCHTSARRRAAPSPARCWPPSAARHPLSCSLPHSAARRRREGCHVVIDKLSWQTTMSRGRRSKLGSRIFTMLYFALGTGNTSISTRLQWW